MITKMWLQKSKGNTDARAETWSTVRTIADFTAGKKFAAQNRKCQILFLGRNLMHYAKNRRLHYAELDTQGEKQYIN